MTPFTILMCDILKEIARREEAHRREELERRQQAESRRHQVEEIRRREEERRRQLEVGTAVLHITPNRPRRTASK